MVERDGLISCGGEEERKHELARIRSLACSRKLGGGGISEGRPVYEDADLGFVSASPRHSIQHTSAGDGSPN